AKNLIRMGHDVVGYDCDKDKIAELAAIGGRLDWPQHIDGIVIATPTQVHDATIDTYQSLSDTPLFVEKPLALKPVKPDHIVMVGYNLRFHACVKKAREWIEAGELGNPLWANLVCAQHNRKYKDSVVFNWSHEIDLALYLIGSVRHVETSSIDPLETIADICLTHDNGCRSTVHLDYVTHPEIRQTIIVGSDAQIIIDTINRCCWLRDKRGIYVDEINSPIDSWEENYYEEMAAFCDRLDGKPTIGATAKEALSVLSICLQAREMAK
ncbi:MAG TPA: hypothetical protein VKB76_18820, partial [Ktedonobacterales bacterium]|nr:hypothetical protein [Ktedonobacterales bacterium]